MQLQHYKEINEIFAWIADRDRNEFVVISFLQKKIIIIIIIDIKFITTVNLQTCSISIGCLYLKMLLLQNIYHFTQVLNHVH